ncbi:MAG: hypothetical protein J7578_21875 [Chitinophagaceae bacterium]|nr:hypothetical protein [Chitinophagaceae bacterium]
MKIRNTVIIPLILLKCLDCSAQLDIGKSIDSFTVLKKDSLFHIITSPAQFEKGYEIIFDSIMYHVGVKDNSIIFISTTDPKFRTQEGACIGMLYSAMDTTKSKIKDLRGWGKVLPLSSGWNAVFDFKVPLRDNSPIQFFYRKK